ncbi:hypothetical protein Lfu02_68240 [Longispora fulva]|uniref:Uncharacterized protein n=1 Tax=Longispora fulva TaxID=619741 RepID=A0A8J7GCT8_9ACTN|nr:hypothetical protein [Longispora fulva]MBG6134077.1 hypothetical protein [Longispora fulva]GIG62452.1 hypothetical protein Lfu02_68240 [Longispora fulva]
MVEQAAGDGAPECNPTEAVDGPAAMSLEQFDLDVGDPAVSDSRPTCLHLWPFGMRQWAEAWLRGGLHLEYPSHARFRADRSRRCHDPVDPSPPTGPDAEDERPDRADEPSAD